MLYSAWMRAAPSIARPAGRAALAVALAAAIGCGGASAAPGPGGGATLGVQSNAPSATTLLRLRPGGSLAFATRLRAELTSEMMGQPLRADLETRGVRRVLDRAADGSLEIEEIETRTRYELSMLGRSRSGGDDASAGPPQPRRYRLSDRGRRAPEPATASPSSAGGGGAGGDAGAVAMPDRFAGALEPLVRALEFPEEPVAPGAEWTSEGTIPLGDVDAELRGTLRFQLTQRLERFEGSGAARTAIISFTGGLAGGGQSAGGGDALERMEGELRFRGFYVVAVDDGFARSARASFEGEARFGAYGPEARLPVRGELEWSAVPIDAALPAAAVTAPAE